MDSLLNKIGLQWSLLESESFVDLLPHKTSNDTVINPIDGVTHIITINPECYCCGVCGDIYFGTFDSFNVVFKQINAELKDAIKEAFIHAILSYYSSLYTKPFIVPLLFVYYDSTKEVFTIVMDRYDGTLKELMNNTQTHQTLLQSFLHEWDLFIEFLEQQHIKLFHNDLRPMNVLFKTVNGENQFAVCDFGMSWIEGQFNNSFNIIVTTKGFYYGDNDDSDEIRKLRDIYTFLYTHETPTTFEEVKQMKKKWKNLMAFYTHFIKDYVKYSGSKIIVDGIILHNAQLLLHQ
jgi:serine/threonine protein kinase